MTDGLLCMSREISISVSSSVSPLYLRQRRLRNICIFQYLIFIQWKIGCWLSEMTDNIASVFN